MCSIFVCYQQSLLDRISCLCTLTRIPGTCLEFVKGKVKGRKMSMFILLAGSKLIIINSFLLSIDNNINGCPSLRVIFRFLKTIYITDIPSPLNLFSIGANEYFDLHFCLSWHNYGDMTIINMIIIDITTADSTKCQTISW